MRRSLPLGAVALLVLVVLVSVAASAATPLARTLAVDESERGQELGSPWTESSRLSVGELASVSSEEIPAELLSSFDTEAPRRWWPVLLSAAVPGLGETATGYRRGWFMMAADAGLWAGVKNQNDKGNDKEVVFEAFALEHWDEDEWKAALASGQLDDYFDLPPGSTVSDVALYVSREQDEREWFENLGKWDVFAWGWEEYSNGWNPEGNSLGGSLGNPVFDTPLRQQYTGLRGESNDAFRNRDRFLTAALLFRVVSVLQTAYLEGFIGGRYGGWQAESAGPSRGWYLEPKGLTGAQLGWKVSY